MEKINSFSDIEWHKKITLGLERIGYEKPTPIQAQSIVPIMKGEDLIGCAETGTGKTAAFSLPALSHLLHSSKSRALVLAPTRELAQQIEKHWQSLSHYCNNLNSVSVIGGSSYHLQLKKIASGQLIIF